MPCPSGSVIYGEWFQQEPKKGKIASVRRALASQPDQFWLFFKSVHENEDDIILNYLRSDYLIIDQQIQKGVQLYRLRSKAALP
jgi:hypothetical protein